MMSARLLQGPELQTVPDVTLGQFFFDSATKYADRVCQIDTFTDQHETFSELKQKSTRVALKMQEKGINSGDVVIVCSSVTLVTPIPILASFFLGANVGNLDPSLSARQTKHLLSLVAPRMIFVEETALPLVEESLQGSTFTPEIVVLGNSSKYQQFSDFMEPHAHEETFVPVVVDVEEEGIMFFSSGSTGLPKAICHSHRSFLTFIFSFFQNSTNLDVILSFTSFYWISGMIFLTLSFLVGGHRLVCGHTIEGERTYQLIQKYKVTYLFLAPVYTYKLTNFAKYTNYDTSSLFSLFTGGTPLSTTQFQKLSTVLKHTRVLYGYGLSEIGLVSMFHPIDDQKLIIDKVGSSGKLLPGITMKIVDPETGKVLGPNQKGEIRVKSSSIMKKYYNSDCSHVFDETNFLKTGDVGYYDEDNCLYVVERIKEMFKYMSWHIVPSAIEAVLLEHASIEEAVVFGLPQGDEVGEIPAACVVLKPGGGTTKQEIEDFVANRVSDRERLRGGVYILPKLFRTSTGKIMRREMRDYIIKSTG